MVFLPATRPSYEAHGKIESAQPFLSTAPRISATDDLRGPVRSLEVLTCARDGAERDEHEE